MDKNDKANLIMNAALEIFQQKSFKDAKISEIAQRAGVATGTVYEYFKNKEDLFFSIPSQTTKQFVENLKIQLEGLTDPIEKIRKYIWFYLYFFENNPIYTELLLMELRVNKNFYSSDYYQGVRDATKDILNIIKEGQEAGNIRNDINPYLIRQFILGPLEQVTTSWLITGKKNQLTSYYKDITLLILSAVSVK